MKIAVDAMGGDYAPEAIVEGSLQAKPQDPIELVLVGNEQRISGILRQHEHSSNIEVVHALDAVAMDEPGPVAIRRKREASVSVAMRFLAENQVDAVVSAGNTSAIVAAAKHYVGLISGLRRPALAVPLPTPSGRVLLLDAGANSEANAIHLAHSAALAQGYLEVTENIFKPRIGLLNIGQEAAKGKKQVRRAFALLSRSVLNFTGNIEPQELFEDRTDAVICDGFVGNVLLKMFEGLSETLLRFLEGQTTGLLSADRSTLSRILQHFQSMFHYRNVGGAPLLGIRRTVVIAHGRSEAGAVANAIHLAARLLKANIYERVAQVLERDRLLAELKHQYTLLMLDQFRNRWSFSHRQ
ncbi:MAG: phosphate acyltransferase PlsX [Deltaproteobacteria bacterium]|jgi:glycerol-3-phosphate acyltransferase PlsX|nr:phosphate acyltransferase PlsX [Deltaproteobacteria bacterium]